MKWTKTDTGYEAVSQLTGTAYKAERTGLRKGGFDLWVGGSNARVGVTLAECKQVAEERDAALAQHSSSVDAANASYDSDETLAPVANDPPQTLPENVTADDLAHAIATPPVAECIDLFGNEIAAAASQSAASQASGTDRPFAPASSRPSSPAVAVAQAAEATDDGSDLAAQLAEYDTQKQATATGKVPAKVAGYTPTDEQRVGLEKAVAMFGEQTGPRVLVLQAGAGAGKTSTLKMIEALLDGRGQYTAFNTSLVAESKAKFKRASCNTTHSLAFRAIGKQYSHRLNGPRVRSEQVAYMLGIQPMEIMDPSWDKPRTLTRSFLAGQLMVAIKAFCQSADREISKRHFRYIDGIDMPTADGKRCYANNDAVKEYLLPFARKAWLDLSSTGGQLPFSHDVYVKVWQLGQGKDRPVIGADYILLDEDQDTAPVFLDVLKQQHHAMLILVGDSNQIIYDWRGAVDAAKAFPNAPRAMLSQSFRFGQAIADVANSILATLDEPTDLVMKGLQTLPSRVAPLAEPRCMLCRTNAGAVSYLLNKMDEGKRGHLIGGGADVVSFVKAAQELKQGKPTSHPELCCFASWQEVVEYSKSDEGEDLKLMVRLIDEFSCERILQALEQMPEEKYADFVVSTAHKSKGREWDTVKLAGDFPLPNKMQDSDRRLIYVAATRAKHVLDLSGCPTFTGGVDETNGGDGKWIPGLVINYTQPMPSADELVAYLAGKQMDAVAAPVAPCTPPAGQPVATSAPVAAPQAGNGQPAQFTWSKYNEQWLVRGPQGHEGQTVTVSKRDGSTQVKRLGQVVQTFPGVALYRPA